MSVEYSGKVLQLAGGELQKRETEHVLQTKFSKQNKEVFERVCQ